MKKILALALGLGITGTTLLPVCAQTTYINDNFDSYTVGQPPPVAPPIYVAAQTTNVAAAGVAGGLFGSVGNVAWINDTSATASQALEYNAGAGPIGSMYISFQLYDNSTTAGTLTFGVGAWTNGVGTKLNSSVARVLGLQITQGALPANNVITIKSTTNNTTGTTMQYNTAIIQNFQIWVNDNDSTAISYLAPDGSGLQSLGANSFIAYDNNALIGAETYAGYAGPPAASGDATLGRIGFDTTSANLSNFYIDNLLVTDVPEPTTLALAGLGGLSLMLFRRQRK